MSQFSYRPTRIGDLPRCIELFRAGGSRGALLDETLLAEFLSQRNLISCVFEESEFGGSSMIRGCGFSGFVSPDTATRACRGEITDLTNTLLTSQRGLAPLLLSRADQARFNAADETHLVMLNFIIDDTPGAPVTEISQICNKAFLETHNGYGLRSYIMEVSNYERKAEMHRQSAMATGCQLVSMPEDTTSQIFFLERSMFDAHPFHMMSLLFLRQLPCLGLTRAQQDMLELALRGYSDEQIATELNVAWDTVRKRWRTIFDRTNRVMPGLFGEALKTISGNTRGLEKRRPLLTFLGSHPEELRPWPHMS